ncbi:MAG: tyrosine-type recombinase/integrase, partial [Candidatus Aenigmatarchaeota archaeon]
MNEYGRRLEHLLSSTTKTNHKTIDRFLNFELVKKGLSDRRRLKYIRVIRIVLDQLNKSLNKLNQKDAEKFFFWIKESSLSDDTKKSYWSVFRILAEWINPKIDVRNFKLKLRLKTKLPEDILSEEEVSKLISACKSIRDKALVSLTYHAATRSGEVRNLKVKDLIFDQYGAVIMVPEEGKTGSRRIRIIEPVPLLAQYMQDHMFRSDPE